MKRWGLFVALLLVMLVGVAADAPPPVKHLPSLTATLNTPLDMPTADALIAQGMAMVKGDGSISSFEEDRAFLIAVEDFESDHQIPRKYSGTLIDVLKDKYRGDSFALLTILLRKSESDRFMTDDDPLVRMKTLEEARTVDAQCQSMFAKEHLALLNGLGAAYIAADMGAHGALRDRGIACYKEVLRYPIYANAVRSSLLELQDQYTDTAIGLVRELGINELSDVYMYPFARQQVVALYPEKARFVSYTDPEEATVIKQTVGLLRALKDKQPADDPMQAHLQASIDLVLAPYANP
jgi:hypothetical protein